MKTDAEEPAPDVEWRFDIDALVFRPSDQGGRCVVHRRAFRTLLGHPASEQECLAYFRIHAAVFKDAARAKIARRGYGDDASFHLTSRDVGRARSNPSAVPDQL
jgi:hypothetical protein